MQFGRRRSCACRGSISASRSRFPHARPKSSPTTSPRATGPSSPIRRSSSRTTSYLAEREKAHPDYLAAGWLMMTNKDSPCLQCHAIGQFKPTGGDQVVNGPDLREVAARFRPDYLLTWIANPRRLIPYTAMPQNIVPHGTVQILVPKTFENQPFDMVRGGSRYALELCQCRRAPARHDGRRHQPNRPRRRPSRAAPGGHGQCTLEQERHAMINLEITKPATFGLSLCLTIVMACCLAGCGGAGTQSDDALVVPPPDTSIASKSRVAAAPGAVEAPPQRRPAPRRRLPLRPPRPPSKPKAGAPSKARSSSTAIRLSSHPGPFKKRARPPRTPKFARSTNPSCPSAS